jgi:molybdopterin-guanine dinucleotide biosynthesis protein A
LHPHLHRHELTGLVLAGGRGSRMGGVDKGLLPFQGQVLTWHALRRLEPQVGRLAVNANRNLADYAALGSPVWPDALPDHPGPLAGFLAGLAHCETPWLATVPCDSPRFPLDLVARLAQGVEASGGHLALACTPGQRHPVFCLMHCRLRASLADFIASGGRQVGRWAQQHAAVEVMFDAPGDEAAFANINTPQELAWHAHPFGG